MEINIEKRIIEMPVKIVIDGKSYPINQRNVDVIRKYWATGDEKVLADLVDFSLDI